MKYKFNFIAIKLAAVLTLIYLTNANCAPISDIEDSDVRLYENFNENDGESASSLEVYPFDAATLNKDALVAQQISELATSQQSPDDEKFRLEDIMKMITFTAISDESEETEIDNDADIKAILEEKPEKVEKEKATLNQATDMLQGEDHIIVQAEEGEELDDDNDSTDCNSVNCDLFPSSKILPELLSTLKETNALNIPDPDVSTDLELEFKLCMDWWTNSDVGGSSATDGGDNIDNMVGSTTSLAPTKTLVSCPIFLVFLLNVMKNIEDKLADASFPLEKDNNDKSTIDIFMQSGLTASLDPLSDYESFGEQLVSPFEPATPQGQNYLVLKKYLENVFGPFRKDSELFNKLSNLETDDDDKTGVFYGQDTGFFYVKSEGGRPLFNPFCILPILLVCLIVALVFNVIYNKYMGIPWDNNKVLKVPRMAFCSTVPDSDSLKVDKKAKEDKLKISA